MIRYRVPDRLSKILNIFMKLWWPMACGPPARAVNFAWEMN
jgi:hypothetical protein